MQELVKNKTGLGKVAYAYNSSYSRGKDEEDCGSRIAQVKS
jgi:hypothetical protein